MKMVLELRPDRRLIDDNFGGYFLSLSSIPSYNVALKNEVDQVYPSDDQYTYIHTKLFTLHNHLFHDPWAGTDVYFIDNKWKVQKSVVNSSTDVLQNIQEVWEIPSNHSRVPGHFPVTMNFPAADVAVLSDGAGTMFIVSRENSYWQIKYGEEVIGKQKPFVIVDSRCLITNSYRLMHVVVLYLEAVVSETSGDEDEKTKVATFVEWLTFAEESSGSWSLQHVRQLKGRGLPDYLYLEPDCNSIYIVSEFPFKYVSDTENPIVQEDENKVKSEKMKIYMWQQNSEEVKIWLNVEEGISKTAVKVEINDLNFSLISGERVVLTGQLFHNIDNDLTTWTLDENRLNIILQKYEKGLMWRELLVDNNLGEEILDDSLVQNVHQQLAHLCSDKVVNANEVFAAPAFNMEQLEECDYAGESQMLYRLDRFSHSITNQYNLAGHQWLFGVKLSVDQAPCLCVRHDVHGCLWQPEVLGDSAEWSCTHVCTFPAFGYILASKQSRKFSLCSTDKSYVVICEANNHIYIYYKDTSSDLRNRKSGSTEKTQVGKLNCIKVESTDPMIGASAISSHLFVLTKSNLYQFRIIT